MRASLSVSICILFLASIISSCSAQPSSEQEERLLSQEDTVRSNPHPFADGFDFPLGPPNGKGYYNAQPFGRNFHLGDDWNGVGGGNTDFGDTIYSVATGKVVFAQNMGGGWGKVVRITHRTDTTLEAPNIEVLYAHMDSFWVKPGSIIQRGEALGTVGNAEGIYLAHLHLEIRSKVGLALGGGYSRNTEGYMNPTAFIKKNRPKK